MKIIFMGTGTSHGIPVIGCNCSVCKSDNPKNHRTRPSILIEYNGKSILVDAATELRLQAVRNDITRINAVLFTHAHADHVFGLDDIRMFNHLQKEVIPCYGNEWTVKELRRVFRYAFLQTQRGGGKPQFDLHVVDGELNLFGLEVIPLEVMHGEVAVLGYRFKDVAYLTDCNKIPDSSMDLLRGLDILILDALRYRPHPTHFSVDEALQVVEELRPRRTLLTHICHDLDHDSTNEKLPRGVELAYDGLQITLRGT